MDTNGFGLKYSLHHSMFDREANGDNKSRLGEEFGKSDTKPPSHRLVLVLPPGQDASRSSVEWNACHRPKSSAVPTVRLPFPPSLVVRFFHRERRKPARPTYREEEAPSINKSVSHRWWTRTDVPRMLLVSRTSFMTRSVTKL